MHSERAASYSSPESSVMSAKSVASTKYNSIVKNIALVANANKKKINCSMMFLFSRLKLASSLTFFMTCTSKHIEKRNMYDTSEKVITKDQNIVLLSLKIPMLCVA